MGNPWGERVNITKFRLGGHEMMNIEVWQTRFSIFNPDNRPMNIRIKKRGGENTTIFLDMINPTKPRGRSKKIISKDSDDDWTD